MVTSESCTATDGLPSAPVATTTAAARSTARTAAATLRAEERVVRVVRPRRCGCGLFGDDVGYDLSSFLHLWCRFDHLDVGAIGCAEAQPHLFQLLVLEQPRRATGLDHRKRSKQRVD